MAVKAVFGRPGAGKSYTAVKEFILPAIKTGRKVVTNIPLNMEAIYAEWPMLNPDLIIVLEPTEDRLTPFQNMTDFEPYTEWKHPVHGFSTLFVIDEAHNAYPRRSRGQQHKNEEIEILKFFTMHRHMGMDIILVSQQAQQVRVDLLGLAQTVIWLNNAHGLGIGAKRFVRKVTDGTKGSVTSPPKVHSYDKKIFKYYSSYTMGGKGEARAKVRSLWLNPFIILPIVMLCFSIPTLVFSDALSFLDPNSHLDKVSTLKDEKKQTSENTDLEEVAPRGIPAQRAKPLKFYSGNSAPAPAILAPPSPEPSYVPPVEVKKEEPEIIYDDGIYRPENVANYSVVRAGQKCRFFLSLRSGETNIRPAMFSLVGWNVSQTPNDGEKRELFGSCTLTIERGDEKMQWYSDRSVGYVPEKRFSAGKSSSTVSSRAFAPSSGASQQNSGPKMTPLEMFRSAASKSASDTSSSLSQHYLPQPPVRQSVEINRLDDASENN